MISISYLVTPAVRRNNVWALNDQELTTFPASAISVGHEVDDGALVFLLGLVYHRFKELALRLAGLVHRGRVHELQRVNLADGQLHGFHDFERNQPITL